MNQDKLSAEDKFQAIYQQLYYQTAGFEKDVKYFVLEALQTATTELQADNAVLVEALERIYDPHWVCSPIEIAETALSNPHPGQGLLDKMAELQAQNTELKQISVNLHWMARRYADGRMTYAPGMANNAARKLMAMGVELNICGERTPWARDGMGPGFSGLSQEEYEMGEPYDGWNGVVASEEMKALAQQVAQLQRENELAHEGGLKLASELLQARSQLTQA